MLDSNSLADTGGSWAESARNRQAHFSPGLQLVVHDRYVETLRQENLLCTYFRVIAGKTCTYGRGETIA
jgi:hypothetical protein